MSKKIDKPETAKKSCFVIMPFGSWFDNYYTEIYVPAITEAGLEPRRADDIYRPSTIVQDIWNCTQESTVVLADLTGKNANVFYELGLAHALAKPAILVTHSMEDVPFDLRALRVIEYNKNDCNWGQILKEKITRSITETLKSPLNAVLPAFLKIDVKDKAEIKINERDFLELKRDMELLRNELRHSTSRPDRIPASDARIILERYIERGMPVEMIIERMTNRYGVPEGWVLSNLERRGNRPELFGNEPTGENG